MKMIPRPGRLALRAGLVTGLAILVAACVADDQQSQSRQQISDTGSAQPRRAVYDCGEDGKIIVEAMSGAVRLTQGEEDVFDLPAAPPGQNSRFGLDGLALVVEGGEALWMRAGKEPLTCKR